MAKLKPAAFLSYVRFDDEHEDGRLSEFRKRLSAEVRMQTGEEFPIFQDRNDISWGQNWQKRIDESIDHSTFLICILTPGFFRSIACRKEVEKFIHREKELSSGDLILPVYYVECPQLRDKKQIAKDKIAKLVNSRQYVDWRELRFEPFTSADAGRSLAKIASQVRDALQRPRGKSKGKRTARQVGPSKPHPKLVAAASASLELQALTEAQRGLEAPAPKNEPLTRVVDSTGRGQYSSIADAIAAADPGNRVLIRPGVYKEHLTLEKPLELIGDGKTEDIVITSSDQDVVSFHTTIGRIANLTIRQDSVDPQEGYIALGISQGRLILENCQLSSTDGPVIWIRGGADPQINHCKIVCLGKLAGVFVKGAEGLIENNEIQAKHGIGLAGSGASGLAIRQNTIRAGFVGVYLYKNSSATVDDNDIAEGSVGIAVSESSDAMVTRNRIHGCTSAGCQIGTGRTTIVANTITDNHGDGIQVEAGGHAVISRNVLGENGGYGITASADASVVLGENTFRGNQSGDTLPKKFPPVPPGTS
jgi:F-box protein 11